VLTPDEFDGRRPHRPPPDDLDRNDKANSGFDGPPDDFPPGPPPAID